MLHIILFLGIITAADLHPTSITPGCQINVDHDRVVTRGIPSVITVTILLNDNNYKELSVNITTTNDTKTMEIDSEFNRIYTSEITTQSYGRSYYNVCVTDCGCSEMSLYSIPGPVTLLPPLLTVAMAIISRQVLLSLVCGIYTAAFLLSAYNPVTAFIETFSNYLVLPFLDPGKAAVVVFSCLMAGLIEMLERSGGAQGLANQIFRLASTAYHAASLTVCLSFVFFFDDFASIMISGKSLKNLVAQLGLSVQKFSFIVHMMAVLVSSLCPLSSWAGIQIGYIESAFSLAGQEVSGFTYLVESIPYRFFVLSALFGVVIYVFINKDIEPMIRYEEEMRYSVSNTQNDANDDDENKEKIPARWFNAIVPLVALVTISIVQMYFDGRTAIEGSGLPVTFLNCVSHSNSINSLIIGTSVSLLITMVMVMSQRILGMSKLLEHFVEGVKGMSEPVMILVLAWALGIAMNNIHTSQYIALALGDSMRVEYFPTIVCLIGYAMSYASGSALGTQGIIFPLVIPVIVHLTDDQEVYLKTIAAACSSSVFGNLCSPIADTTIAGVLFTGCPMIDHIKVMSTFCIPLGVISLILGDLMVGLNLYPFWVAYLIALSIILLVFLIFGRTPRKYSLLSRFFARRNGHTLSTVSSLDTSEESEKLRLIQDKI